MIRPLFAALLLTTPAVAQQRVLSLGGATTEIVYALGAGSSLIAADSTSTFPAAAAALPKLGYVRALSAEGMLSMAPDMVLAAPEAGPPAVLDQVTAAGLRVIHLPDGATEAGLLDRIRAVGASLNRPGPAAMLAADVQAKLARVQPPSPPRPPTRTSCSSCAPAGALPSLQGAIPRPTP